MNTDFACLLHRSINGRSDTPQSHIVSGGWRVGTCIPRGVQLLDFRSLMAGPTNGTLEQTHQLQSSHGLHYKLHAH
jgi:hypothetical protein